MHCVTNLSSPPPPPRRHATSTTASLHSFLFCRLCGDPYWDLTHHFAEIPTALVTTGSISHIEESIVVILTGRERATPQCFD